MLKLVIIEKKKTRTIFAKDRDELLEKFPAEKVAKKEKPETLKKDD